jgi:hypothetical protein
LRRCRPTTVGEPLGLRDASCTSFGDCVEELSGSGIEHLKRDRGIPASLSLVLKLICRKWCGEGIPCHFARGSARQDAEDIAGCREVTKVTTDTNAFLNRLTGSLLSLGRRQESWGEKENGDEDA